MFSFILLISCIILHVQTNPVTTYLECPAGTNDCVKNAIQVLYTTILKPNPNIGAEEMDPMFQELIEGDLSTVKYKLKNSTVKGFRSCKIQKATSNPEESKLQFTMLCQYFDMRGQYDIEGALLSRKVVGDGDYVLLSGKYNINVDLEFQKTSKNHKQYMKIEKYSFKAEPLEPVTYNLTNLYGGNKELGDSLLRFANKNWRPITLLLQGPTLAANLKKIFQNGNKYLKIYPIN